MSTVAWTDLPEDLRLEILSRHPELATVQITDGEITYFFKDDPSPYSIKEFKCGTSTYNHLLDIAILLDGYVYASGYTEERLHTD